MTCDLRHRESSSDYGKVIACAQRYRVAVCKDGVQWILQKRVSLAESRSGGVWRSVSYHIERKSLIRLWNASVGLPAPEAITTLPSFFPTRS